MINEDKINKAKEKYNKAKENGDTAGMESAHAEAEAVRATEGYSGGDDGSQRISLEPTWIGSGGKSTTSGATNTNESTYESDLNRLKTLQQKATINSLKAQKESTIRALDEQASAIKPEYARQRNLASGISEQNARSFAEYLANRGLTYSGASAEAESNRHTGLMNTLGTLGTQEAKAYEDIAKAKTNAETDYVSNLAKANSELEAEYFNNMLQENQRKRLEAEQLKSQGMLAYSDDYMAEINRLLGLGYSENSPEVLQLKALRGQKIANNYNISREQALSDIVNGNINYNTMKAGGFNTIEEAQAYRNNYLAQLQAQAEAEARQQEFENYVTSKKLANDTLKTQYDINKPYYNLDQGDGTISLNEYKDVIQNRFLKTVQNPNAMNDGKEYITKVKDANELLDYIEAENKSGRMGDDDAILLMTTYGLGPFGETSSNWLNKFVSTFIK